MKIEIISPQSLAVTAVTRDTTSVTVLPYGDTGRLTKTLIHAQ